MHVVLDFELPSLCSQLTGFQAWTIYDHELSDRVVDRRMDPVTGEEVDVTEHDYVATRLGGAVNGRIRRTTYFRGDDGTLCRWNPAWEDCSHYGIQYATTCEVCGRERWNNADRAPAALCALCREQQSTTGRCPSLELACSTAYKGYGCRCGACRAWNAAKSRRLRAQRRRNPQVSHQELHRKNSSCTELLLRTNEGVTTHPPACSRPPIRVERAWDPAGWTWLPEDVRAALARHAAELDAALEDTA